MNGNTFAERQKYMAGMQEQSIEPELFHLAVESLVTVLPVTCNRVAGVGSMYADLVLLLVVPVVDR